MDSQSLQAFIAVAEHQSFSRAAEVLFLTQPAISKRISNFEQQLDTPLFDRMGRKTRLTDAGQLLLPKAREILQAMEDAKRLMDETTTTIRGTLKLGISHHVGLHRLPPVLRTFSQNYPQVKLDIQFIDSEEAYEGILDGSLELGLVTLPPNANPQAKTELIWSDPLVFMVAKDHELANSNVISLQELTRHQAILPSLNTFTRRIVESLFTQHQLNIDTAISTNYLETIKMMVSIGLGWTVLPAIMADTQVKVLDVKEAKLTRELGVVYHPNKTLSNAASAMLELLHQEKRGD